MVVTEALGVKRDEKKARKLRRGLELLEAEYAAKMCYLMVQEMEHERRVRNRAIRLTRKRKVGYIA